MRPPICAVCRLRFAPDEGGLVTFAKSAAGERFAARRRATPGFVGHPPDLEWFCGAHLAAAKALCDGPRDEAVRALREAHEGGKAPVS